MINKVKTGKPLTLLYKVIIAVFNAVMLSGVFLYIISLVSQIDIY